MLRPKGVRGRRSNDLRQALHEPPPPPLLELGSRKERDRLVREPHSPARPLSGKFSSSSVVMVVQCLSESTWFGEKDRVQAACRGAEPRVWSRKKL